LTRSEGTVINVDLTIYTSVPKRTATMVEINLMFAGSMLTRVGKAFMDFNIAEFAFISARAVTVIVSNEISTSATISTLDRYALVNIYATFMH
jgi:hypothetical protein